jgi:exo-1,4-beta-D-glucosaminidase
MKLKPFPAILLLVLPLIIVDGKEGGSVASNRLDLSGDWTMQSSFLEPGPGSLLSQPGHATRNWHRVKVPTTVLKALIKAGVYPDLRVGMNAYRIPDSSDEFNAQHDLARFSHLPNRRNPWRDPWWFRREFTLPKLPADRRAWLHFDAINYRAEVWLNGQPIADRREMAGMFQRFQFDITRQAKVGQNVLAVKICPVDHPGLPQKQVEVLGPDRSYQSELMLDVTEIMTIGYDCMMTVPDRNMGLWQGVWLDWTGPVDIRHPFVITDLPLPETNRATLRVSAELVNATAAPVRGVLRGAVAGTTVSFAAPVELAAGETKVVSIEPKPVMEHPRLWWPVNYGEQHLYELALTFETGGTVSQTARVAFGVRQVGCEMREINGYYGRRVLINGQKILCRGGYIQPELIFDWDAERMDKELRSYARANLNLIYFEDIPNPPEPFLELCDRYGVLFGNVFYSCFWLRPGTPYPADFALLERCTVDLIKRYRNHPSLILYMAMNEEDTKEEVYEMWRRHILALDGTRWFIPSGYFPSDRRNVADWFKKDLPTGMTDKGASYSWAEPEQYFRWVREARNWMFMMESGSASLPPISSLSRFLPEVSEPATTKGPHYPLDADWAHHGANQYFKGYDAALRRLHGEPESVVDYCWKGHLVTADQHRSMHEAVNHRLWDITSGFTQWKINACEPSIQWQVFDWRLKPMVSWFYIKKAAEPLHVQLNLPDRRVSVINTRLAPQPGLEARARVLDLNARRLWEKTAPVEAPANAYRDCFEVPEPADATPVYFVKLELRDAAGRLVSDNFYWLRGRGAPDFKALESLPLLKLTATCQTETSGAEKLACVKITNPTTHIAFFVQLALTQRRGGAEILPVLWDDNYFSLLPGESREITARFAAKDAGGGRPVLEVGGWNLESDFDCAALTVAPAVIKAGEPFTVTAAISNTFLDGSRVMLRLDGQPAGAKWAWARDRQTHHLEFPLKLGQPGKHEVRVGNQRLELTVQP